MPFVPFFLPTPDGSRFCLHHPAAGPLRRGAMVYLHPFAEEMNKSRRMVAMQARALAEAGFDVLQIDLLGCGDSSGDFGEASWSDWIDDGLRAVAWLRERTSAPLWLWGLRSGGLLAAQLASALAGRLDEKPGLLLWNPTPSGKTFLRQFLRLKTAAELVAGARGGGVEAIRDQLAAGHTQEIAGYRLSPALAMPLEAAELDSGAGFRQVRWLETSSRQDAALSPAASAAFDALKTRAADVRQCLVNGPAFWQTTEIEDAPALIAATLAEVGAAP